MSADSNSGLLDRSRSLVQGRAIIEVASPALSAAVDYGVGLFGRLLEAPRKDETEDQRLALVFPYLALIEMLDGVEVLLSASAPIPARLPLRAMFEAMLTIDFILEADTQRRALAWVLCEVHRRIGIYETHDPATDAGRQYQRDYRNDSYARYPQPTINSTEPVAKLRQMFAHPQYVEIEAEYQRLRRARRRSPRWYSLYGGPRNLKELAQCCRKGGQYGLLYRDWSSTAHVSDLHRQLLPSTPSALRVKVLREPSETRVSASLGISLFLDATRRLIEHYLPDELPAWREWYKEKIRGRYDSLATGVLRQPM